MKLINALPIEFVELLLNDCKTRKFADIKVISKFDSRKRKWVGTHKNVTYWYELENGYAVGLNENPSRGLSIPVVKLK